VAANQAKVTALRAELETLSAGMQAQFDALNAQREAYDALQVSLAEHTTEVKARQRSLDSAWQSLSGKQAAENTASAALRTQQAQAQQWQEKLDAAKASVVDKSGQLTNLSTDLTVHRQALEQAKQDRDAAKTALAAAKSELASAQTLRSAISERLIGLLSNPNSVKMNERMKALLSDFGKDRNPRSFPAWLFRELAAHKINPRARYSWGESSSFSWSGYGSIEHPERYFIAHSQYNHNDVAAMRVFASNTLAPEQRLHSLVRRISGGERIGQDDIQQLCAQIRSYGSFLSKMDEVYTRYYDRIDPIAQRISRNIALYRGNNWSALEKAIGELNTYGNIAHIMIYTRTHSRAMQRHLNSVLSVITELDAANQQAQDLASQVQSYEQALERHHALISESETKVRQVEQAKTQAQQALNSARSNVAKANTQLTSANQAMDRAKASLSSATAEREAAEQLLSQASTHLSTAQADKARVASELLAARTTLNQASTQFAKAHQSLRGTAQSLNQAGERLGSAIDLHAEVNVSLNQANRAQYQAKAAIDRAQGQVDIARYTAWRQASVEVASHDTDYEYDARGQLVTERSAVVSFADVQKDKPVTQFIGR
ncbi:hypothetical protein MHN79_20695, partial [Vibrio sp. Of14-4]|uniref:hypothetical protein n=1 Tax=Vibrio sp. Of14-4 TaxID=2724878 RepID=UPI001EF33664